MFLNLFFPPRTSLTDILKWSFSPPLHITHAVFSAGKSISWVFSPVRIHSVICSPDRGSVVFREWSPSCWSASTASTSTTPLPTSLSLQARRRPSPGRRSSTSSTSFSVRPWPWTLRTACPFKTGSFCSNPVTPSLSVSDQRKPLQLRSVLWQPGLAGQQAGPPGGLLRCLLPFFILTLFGFIALKGFSMITLILFLHIYCMYIPGEKDVSVESYSASRNSGGAVLCPHWESRGSEHHPREPHQVHHLSPGQARAEPQGGPAGLQQNSDLSPDPQLPGEGKIFELLSYV